MRSFLVAFAGLMLFATGAAQAKVSITVDKNAQMMTVAVDGVERYQWPVSTGNPSHETPNGTFRTFRMEADHFSKEFDDAPMPHSIFFTKVGHAIHGTESEGRLGTPVSHGCVRLSRANATTLYALVRKGRRAQHHRDADRLVADRAGAQSADRANTAVARRDPTRSNTRRNTIAAGDPRRMLTPPQQPTPRPQYAPQVRRRRRLYLSGRRQLGRRALSGAARQPPPLRRAGLSAATAAAILRQPRLCAAISRRRSTRRGRITARAVRLRDYALRYPNHGHRPALSPGM